MLRTQSKVLEEGSLIAWNLAAYECLKQSARGVAELVVFAAAQRGGVRIDPRLHAFIVLALKATRSTPLDPGLRFRRGASGRSGQAEALFAAAERKDLAALDTLYAGDSLLVIEGSGINRGWHDYRDNHIGPELKEFANFKYRPFEIEARVSGDIAWATYRYAISADMGERKLDSIGRGTAILEKRGTKWARMNGPLVSNTAVEDLLTTVAGLRALRVVSYGAPAGFGLDKPTLTLQLIFSQKDAKPVTIRVGDAHKEDGKVVGHHGIVEGRNVSYLLPLTSVEALLKTKL